MHVAELETGLLFSFGPWAYQLNLEYHTTGTVGFFFSGHQFGSVNGSWHGMQAEPSRSSSAKAGGAASIVRQTSSIKIASQSFGG